MAPPGATAKHFHDLNRSYVDILTVPFCSYDDSKIKYPIVMKIFNCSNIIITYRFCLSERKNKKLL